MDRLRKINRKIWIILISALVLRIFLSLSTFHPDIRAFNLGGQLVASGNIFNLYDFLAMCTSDNPLVEVFGTDLFIYPPLIYMVHGIFNLIFGVIFGQDIVNGFMIENAQSFGNLFFNLHLLLLKFPYFIFDVLAAVFFAKLFNEPKKKVLAFSLWLFNPVNLYATYMIGQFDLIAVFFTILCLYFVKKDKLDLAGLSLGMGIAFKLYPILLLFPLILLGKNRYQKAVIGILGVLPYLITILPFLPSSGFRSSALVAGQVSKSLFANIPVSGGESLLIFPLFLIFAYFIFLNSKIMAEFLWEKFLVILLLFFIFTHFHPQWFLWVTPFLLIDLVKNNFSRIWVQLVILGAFLGQLFFFDSSLTTGIFGPLFPELYGINDLWSLLGLNLDYNFARSILQTALAAGGFYYVYYFLLKKGFPKTEN